MGLLQLVRHGQASFGAEDYDVLSETGWEQGRELGRWLAARGPRPQTVLHGGMRRHRETWAALCAGSGWDPAVEVDEDWAEFDHLAVLARYAELVPGAPVAGGMDRRVFQAHLEAATEHWHSATVAYPEPYGDFVQRAQRALDAAAARPGPTLVVTSGGVIAAVAALLVLPPGMPIGPVSARFMAVIANTSMSQVVVGPTGIRLLTFNEHQHLARDLVTYR